MCCGSRRSAWRSASTAPAAASGRSQKAVAPAGGPVTESRGPSQARGPFPSVLLDYLDGSAMAVRGPVTGQRYDFLPGGSSLAVDARDAAVLTRNSAFRVVAS